MSRLRGDLLPSLSVPSCLQAADRLNSVGEAVTAEYRDGTRRIIGWNPSHRQRTTWSAPGADQLDVINCTDDWCIGVGEVTYPGPAQEFRVVRTTRDTGTSTVGYNAFRLRVSGTVGSTSCLRSAESAPASWLWSRVATPLGRE